MLYRLDIPIDWMTANKYIGKAYCNIYDSTGKNPPDGLTLCGKYKWLGLNPDGSSKYEPYERNDKYFVDHCYFDNTGVDPKLADEALSVIWGGKARIQNCYFKNWGKAMIIGNGDDPIDIAKDIYVEIENCVFDGCSRRNPYIRGATVHMKNCLIKNWGHTFFDKSFGVRVDREGSLYISDCVFIQDHFIHTNLLNFFKDCYGQIMDKSQLLNIFKPGCTRGLFTESYGSIIFIDSIYKNRWWISIENSSKDNHPLDKYDANKIIADILDSVPNSKKEALEFGKIYNKI